MQKLSDKILKNVRAVIFAAMVVLIGLCFAVTMLMVRPRIDTLFTAVAQTKAGAIDYFLNRRLKELALLRQVYQPQGSTRENLDAFDTYGRMLGVYASLGLVDEEGVVHTTSGASFSIRERDYYQKALVSREPYVLSEVLFSQEDNEPIVIVLMPLEDGRFFSAAIGAQYVVEVMEGSTPFPAVTRLIGPGGQTDLETGPLPWQARTYLAQVPVHPGWQLEIGVSPLYVDAIFYLLGGFLLAGFGLMYQGLNRALTRRVEAELRPLEAIARDMAATDLTDPKPLEIDAHSAETAGILAGYNTLRQRIAALLETVQAEQKSRMESDYQALLEQIKPHFLYNTLETIQVMALDYEDDRIGDALGLLGRYFRLSLADGAQLVPLDHELELVRTYVQLQKLRYGERLHLKIQAELRPGEYTVLKFILQPVVENALYHGIKLLPQGGTITVRLTEEEGWLVIRVENPCPEPDTARLDQLARALETGQKLPGSNGLYNVNQRLRLRYGRQCLFVGYGGEQVQVEIRLKQEECHEYPDRG